MSRMRIPPKNLLEGVNSMEVSRAESLRINLTLQINDLTVTGEWTPIGGLVWEKIPFSHLRAGFPDPSLLNIGHQVCPACLEQTYWPFVAECHALLLEVIDHLI